VNDQFVIGSLLAILLALGFENKLRKTQANLKGILSVSGIVFVTDVDVVYENLYILNCGNYQLHDKTIIILLIGLLC